MEVRYEYQAMIPEHNIVIKIIFRTQMIVDTCNIRSKPVKIIRPPIFDIDWVHSLGLSKYTHETQIYDNLERVVIDLFNALCSKYHFTVN